MFKIIRYIYSFYSIMVFMSLTVVMIFCYLFLFLVPYNKQINGVFFINRIFVFIWSKLVGIQFKITGVENINIQQQYVVVSNHLNIMDMFAIGYGLEIAAKPLIKKELLKIPFLGQLFLLGTISVDRSSKEARKASKQKLLDDLKKGISIMIFPEGTRNRTNLPLKDFYDGAFELAKEANVPILPVCLVNIRKLNIENTMQYKPGTIEVHHLQPILPNNFENIESFKNYVHQIMYTYLQENDDNYKVLI